MNRFLISAAALMASLAMGAQQRYTINATVDPSHNGKKVWLFEPGEKAIDSTIVKGGRFSFKGNLPKPTYMVMNTTNDKGWAITLGEAFLEKGTITIVDGVAKGTPTNDKWALYKKSISGIEANQKSLRAEYDKIAKKYQEDVKAGRPVDTVAIRTAASALNDKFEEGTRKMAKISYDYAMKNLDNPSPAQFILRFEDHYTFNEADAMIAGASPVLRETRYFQTFISHVQGKKRSVAGAKFTDFDLFDLDGNKVKLSDYVGKGKYIFIDYWASWCGPCRAEIPTVRKVWEKYRNKGFDVVSISLDATEAVWKNAVSQLDMPWTQLSDLQEFKGPAAKAYAVKAIPFTMLIGPDGTILETNLRGEKIDPGVGKYLVK
ncbi:MAG: AhpC/TSA family protein [Bacteroidales bacterium]|nr:AhpC/TSA family protein [Bacteroidales bacterium]